MKNLNDVMHNNRPRWQHNLYNSEWAKKNKKNIKLIRTKSAIKKNEFYKFLKKDKKCSNCEEQDVRCLDFHHIDKKNKKSEISNLVNRLYSNKVILEEANKCIVLCANCHRKLHFNTKN